MQDSAETEAVRNEGEYVPYGIIWRTQGQSDY